VATLRQSFEQLESSWGMAATQTIPCHQPIHISISICNRVEASQSQRARELRAVAAKEQLLRENVQNLIKLK